MKEGPTGALPEVQVIAFQEMLERIRREHDVDYVIVYKPSRFARNRIDDAVVIAGLEKRGVELVSATESIDATPVGQLMHGILAAFNEHRSREDGADFAYKMAQEAKNDAHDHAIGDDVKEPLEEILAAHRGWTSLTAGTDQKRLSSPASTTTVILVTLSGWAHGALRKQATTRSEARFRVESRNSWGCRRRGRSRRPVDRGIDGTK